MNQTANEVELLQCQDEALNPFAVTCPLEEEKGPISPKESQLTLDNFDDVRNKGLPKNYDLEDGWWLKRQNQIISSLDPFRFAELSIEITKLGPVQNSGS